MTRPSWQCLEPPSVRFGAFFARSDNPRRDRDLERARAMLNFAPQDRAEEDR